MDKKAITCFFDKCSEKWDENLKTDDNKMNEIMDAAGIGQDKRILDIACGTGVMFNYYLNRDVSEITGVDISSKMIEICRKKFSNNEKINVICGDADEIEFCNKYDCCMIFNAFPHFCSPLQLLKNLKKSVKTGGSITVAHDDGRNAIDKHHLGEAKPYSNGLMSADDLVDIFEKAGLNVKIKISRDDIYIVSATV